MALGSDPFNGNGPRGMSSLQKASIGLLGVVGLGAIVGIFRQDWLALLIALGGTVAVVVVLAVYVALLRWWNRRRAEPLRQALIDNSSASPHAINEPARRAKLDALRQSFESGIAKFTAAGKDLYKLPWYLLVGAPGSGKTEAIRNCSIGFPPGLQDTLQGTGGTLNMNWWFTNEGVILDTAGRLMFEEVPPGSTNEWTEFLEMLSNHRGNCPINGMLLVIPAESLIRDKGDLIERNANRIAQQFDSIQRALGVRFPVFVLVTKCDLVNGFREFFDTLNDPQLQHQMLGWSNPAPLDTPFEPEQVDRHLGSVRERLLRRRYGLLIDPIHTEDPNGRRIEQVDALYAFPDSFIQLAPRLRRYLEMIFTTSEWSPKPLFLRGIYFTSAMREGSALDAELAQVLRVPVESLPEGRVWQRERSFFLRDLFLKKVYRESGLVTRSANTGRLQRRRRLAVLGTGFTALAIFAGFTALGARQLGDSIGEEAAFWSRLEGAVRTPGTQWSLVRDGRWSEETYLLGRDPLKLPALLEQAAQHTAGIDTPAIFATARVVTRDLDPTKREAALRKLFASGVLRPGVEQARARMRSIADARRPTTAAAPTGTSQPTVNPWSDRATDALAQLVWIEAELAGVAPHATGDRDGAGARPASEFGIRLRALYDFALDDPGADLAPLDAQLQPIFDRLYGSVAPSVGARAALIHEDCGSDLETVQRGVERFLDYWHAQIDGKNPTISSIGDLRVAVNDFKSAEENLHKFAAAHDKFDDATYDQTLREWRDLLDRVRSAATKLDQSITEASARSEAWNPEQPMLKAFEAEQRKMTAAALRQTGQLITLLSGVDRKDNAPVGATADRVSQSSDASRDALRKLRDRLTEGSRPWMTASGAETAGGYKQILADLDATYLARIDGEPAFKRRLAAYVDADGCIPKLGETPQPADPISVLDVAKAMRESLQPVDDASKRLDALSRGAPPANPTKRTCQFALAQLATPALREQKLSAVLAPFVARADSIGSVAESIVKMPDVTLTRMVAPKLPMTNAAGAERLDDRFNPDVAKKLAAAVTAVQEEIRKPEMRGVAALSKQFAALKEQALPQYYAAYVKYWTEAVPGRLDVKQYDTWKQYQDDLRNVTADSANTELRRVFRMVLDALTVVPQGSRSEDLEHKLNELTRLKEVLDDSVYRRWTTDMVSGWAGLDADPARARAQLLAIPAEQMRARYLAHENMPYWRDVVRRGVGLLKLEAGKGAGGGAAD